jgi:superfamily II DNA or RNA helicase
MKTKRDEIQERISDIFRNAGFFGIILAAPRVGKIRITLNCLDTKDNVMIAYPETSIKQSWIADIKKWKFKGGKIKYTTYMSFKKLKDPVDVLVLDEVHLISPAQMVHIANYIVNFNIKKVIGLTGTLAPDTRENLLKGLKLPVLVEYPIDEAIADGVITDYRIEVLTTPLSTIKDIHVKWKGGEFDTSEKASFDYLTYKISSEQSPLKRKMLRLQRMSLIKKSFAKIALTKKVLKESGNERVLVFTGLIDVADGLGIDSYHSKSKDDSAALSFISGKTNKLAVVRQLNTGVTFKKLNKAIINFFDSNAENMAQKISRITCLEYDNKDKIANIVIICSDEEQEKIWLSKALSFFDQNKIKFIN